MKFNIPYLSGKEKEYVSRAIESRCISGDGAFTKKCQIWFEKKFGFKKTFLTTSCTDALEMSAILLDIKAGDEVIVPSFTFVSTANAFYCVAQELCLQILLLILLIWMQIN